MSFVLKDKLITVGNNLKGFQTKLYEYKHVQMHYLLAKYTGDKYRGAADNEKIKPLPDMADL